MLKFNTFALSSSKSSSTDLWAQRRVRIFNWIFSHFQLSSWLECIREWGLVYSIIQCFCRRFFVHLMHHGLNSKKFNLWREFLSFFNIYFKKLFKNAFLSLIAHQYFSINQHYTSIHAHCISNQQSVINWVYKKSRVKKENKYKSHNRVCIAEITIFRF